MLTNQVVYSITILLDRGTVGFYASRSFYLAENTKICYTYDNLNRVIRSQIIELECECVLSQENYSYDAAGNIINAPGSYFTYDTNNRLIQFDGDYVSYDMDGNMLSNGYINCEFDSGNRLISAGGHTYTYNAEDVRIRNLCADADTTYTYNTNCRLSQLLCKTTNGITTKYVYGLGLIGEEKEGCFKTYHFDFRGSTVAITDECGNITDTFKYDTYGKLISRTGNSFVILGYNGRDGVVTDRNGLLYMRARYYSPAMRRFINADIISGEISNAITLNRYAYANGNPVSNTDPFGLSAERGNVSSDSDYTISPFDLVQYFASAVDGFELSIGKVKFVKDGQYINIKGDRAILDKFNINQTRIKADNIKNFKGIAELANVNYAVSKALKSKANWGLSALTIVWDTVSEVSQYEETADRWIVGSYTVISGVLGAGLSIAGSAAAAAAVGSAICPGVGTIAGIVASVAIGWIYEEFVDAPVKENIVIELVERY